MNTIIFLLSTAVALACLLPTLRLVRIGYYGFSMRGGAFGIESLHAFLAVMLEGLMIGLAATHVPFSITFHWHG